MHTKKSRKNSDELESVLGEFAGSKKKMSKKKKIIISSVAVVLAASIAAGSVLIVKYKRSSTDEVTYREYKAERGNIITGQTESSVITLNKETITFPVGAEVLEVYIKSGSHVKEGDPLLKMSIDDINDALEDCQEEIDSARADIENAKISRKTELAKAKETMEQSLAGGDSSESKYNLTVKQAAMDLSDAQDAVDTAQDKYDDLVSQYKTFSRDKKNLDTYESKMNTAQTALEYWTGLQTDYSSISAKLSEVETQIGKLTDLDDMNSVNAYLKELEDAYDEACGTYGESSQEASAAKEKVESYEKIVSQVKPLFEQKTEYEKELDAFTYDSDKIDVNVTAAQATYDEAKENYENYKSDFTDTYGQITTSDALDDELEAAEKSLSKAKLSLEKQQNEYDSAILQAQETKDSSNVTASNAVQTYNLKKIELDQKVNEAVDKYNELVDDFEETKESIGNNGVISAPCDGIVSSLNVEEGDEITVASSSDSESSNMFASATTAELLTITDMSEAYVSISISEDEILDVSLDQEASVVLEAFSDETFDGVVDSITVEGATMGAATVTYDVNVKFEQEGHDLYDGMSADVTLIDGSAMDVIYVTKQAVTTEDGKSYVNLKGEDGEPVKTEVRTGFTDGQYVEIISGLNEGDTVLAESAMGSAGKNAASGDMPSGDMPSGDFDMSDMTMPSGGDFGGGMAGAGQ